MAAFAPVAAFAQSKPLQLTLPTDNTSIFSDDPSDFYMYTNRNFEGVSSKPWTGGKYGYVRNQKRTADGVIMTRFHEGVDIRPVRRDGSGKPLDVVRAIAPGKVVYINTVSSRSSYGNYVVVEHDWGYGPFYSLYAHLMTISVKTGQQVTNKTTLGRLGYTGSGLNVDRSHLHLELNLFLSSRFEKWHDKHFTSPNHHKTYNGINMAGLDIAGLYLRHRENPNITIPEFISRMTVYYKVLVPNKGKIEILKRYPWIGKNLHLAQGNPSWEIHFSQSGIPIAIVPSAIATTTPKVTWVQYSKTFHSYHTRGRIGGSGSKGSLTDSGKRYIELVTGQF